MGNETLVENKKVLHKSSTVILSAVLVVVSILEIIQPWLSTLQPVINVNWFPYITAGIGVSIGIGRYIKQEILRTPAERVEEEDVRP